MIRYTAESNRDRRTDIGVGNCPSKHVAQYLRDHRHHDRDTDVVMFDF